MTKHIKTMLIAALLLGTLLPLTQAAMAEGDGNTVYRAMLLGIESYSGVTLVGSSTDANRMVGTLQAANEAGNIYQTPQTRTNLKASEIKTLLGDMQAWGMDNDDVTLFYYAGLGELNESGAASLTGRGGDALKISELRSALDKLPGVKIVVMDVRFLESQAQKAKLDDAQAVSRLNAAIADAFRGGQTDNKHQVISGVSMVKTVTEGDKLLEASAGLFTYYLTQGCGYDYQQQRACPLDADASQNNAVSMSEARDYIIKNLDALNQQAGGKLNYDVRTYPDDSAYPLLSKRATAEILSLTLSQEVLSIAAGKTAKLEASVQPANAQFSGVTWFSSDLAVASVDEDGLIQGIREGSADVTALASNGMTAQCKVMVRKVVFADSITLNVSKMVIESGRKEQLKLTITPSDSNELVTWKSNDPSVASVDGNGLVQTQRNGIAIITATTEGGKEVSCTFQIVDADSVVAELRLGTNTVSLAEGDAKQLTAAVKPGKAADSTIAWTSSDPGIASVDRDGLLVANGPGECTVTATASSGISDRIKVSVKGAQIKFKERQITLKKGQKSKINWTIEPSGTLLDVTWSSSNPDVVTVDDNGRLEGLANGESAVTGTLPSGMKAVCRVSVASVVVKGVKLNRNKLGLTVGQQGRLIGKVSPGNASIQTLSWKSGNEKIALIDDTGTITATGVGKTTITGTTHNGKTAKCLLTVNPVRVTSISLNVSNETLMLGQDEPLQIQAEVEPVSSIGNRALSWSSSNPKVASVDPNGLVTPKSPGKVTIRATSGKKVKASCTITVAINGTHNKKPKVGKSRKVYASLRQLYYEDSQMIVQMYYVNRTKKSVKIPQEGVLRLTLETGEVIDLMEISTDDKPATLKPGKTATRTFKISTADNENLAGLNLRNAKVEVAAEGSDADAAGDGDDGTIPVDDEAT